MNRKFTEKLTYFECAKAAVEQFIKWEHRKQTKAKYILQFYQGQPQIKTDKEMIAHLKGSEAFGCSDAGSALANLFDMLNVYRTQDGGDLPGKGRYPGSQETCLIFWITDDTMYSNDHSVTEKLNIPGLKSPGADAYLEPFRWEQRLYTIVLASKSDETKPVTGIMSEAVGGHCWTVSSLSDLLMVMDNCQGLSPNRVNNRALGFPVCHFEGVSIVVDSHPKNQTPFPTERLFLYANSSTSKNFMIPESFWPLTYKGEQAFSRFPPRAAHPVLTVSTKDEVYHIFDGYPCDRLSMEKSHLSDQLLKRPKGTCWALYVKNSYIKPGYGMSFGFFRVSSAGTVNLYLLPYDFPRLFRILARARKFKAGNIPSEIRTQFTEYLQDIPCYYWHGVMKSLETVKLNSLYVPQPWHGLADELTRSCEVIVKKAVAALRMMDSTTKPHTLEVKKKKSSPFEALKEQFQEFLVSLRNSGPSQVAKHSVPIAEMGDYISFISKQKPLRDAYEDDDEAVARQRSLFGNPYKKLKKSSKDSQDSVMLNEEEEEGSHEFDAESTAASVSAAKRKWIRLPKSFASKLPPLGLPGAIVIPDFKGLKFTPSLEEFESSKHEFIEQAQKSILVGHSSSVQPSATSMPPSIPILDTDEVVLDVDESSSLDDMEIKSELEAGIQDPQTSVPNSVITEQIMSWEDFENNYYHLVSAWPRDYDEESILSLLNAYFETDVDENGRQAKLKRVSKLAQGFGHSEVVKRIQEIES